MWFGWHDRPKDVDAIVSKLPVPVFPVKANNADEDSLLYLTVRKVSGTDLDPGPQAIGDCTSWGWAGCVDTVQCVEIDAGRAEKFKRTATEAIYALERVEVGKGQIRGDGGVGAWCAEAVSKYGTLSRDVVGTYSGQRAKQWGNQGLSKEMEDQARSHLIKTVSQVTSAEQVKQAIQNRYPVAVCSNRGFTMTRDRQGFCAPRGSWGHCMKIIAYRGGGRPGLLIVQSWGPNTPDGPKDLDQPDNSFWAEMDVVDSMVRQGDSFTMSQFEGYPDQDTVSWTH